MHFYYSALLCYKTACFSCRQQEEREIRHKLKKGEIDDIPRDVLDTFPTLLSAPAKGTGYYSESISIRFEKTSDLFSTCLMLSPLNGLK